MNSEKKDELERFAILCKAKITAPNTLGSLDAQKSSIDRDIDRAMAQQVRGVGDFNILETLKSDINVLYQSESFSLARADASEKPKVPSVTRPSFTTKQEEKHTLIKRQGAAVENKVNATADVKKLESLLNSQSTLEKEAALKEFRKETGNTHTNAVVSRQGTPVSELKEREEAEVESKNQLYTGIQKLIQAIDKAGVNDKETQDWRVFLSNKIDPKSEKTLAPTEDNDETKLMESMAETNTVEKKSWSSDPEWFDKFDPRAEELAQEELKFAQTYAKALASRREFLKMKESLNSKYKESGIDPIKEDID